MPLFFSDTLVDAKVERLSFSVIYEETLFKFLSQVNIYIFFMLFRNTDDLFIRYGNDIEFPADPHRGVSSPIFLTVFRVCECQEYILIVQYAVYGKAAEQSLIRRMHGKKASGLQKAFDTVPVFWEAPGLVEDGFDGFNLRGGEGWFLWCCCIHHIGFLSKYILAFFILHPDYP